ncbi:MAG: tRNA preQ1(34) S-adenosylmethionine ribosyltransferase-isomerase QueA, partial [Planctomycetes bacterium]|nr:tRNA preQ1(34) S-adenosylmethionine ribosyltransferase-isomerase QueA [Planctomycetota bacterium]
LVLVERGERGAWLVEELNSAGPPLLALLDQEGVMPLPPYIKRERDDARGDDDRDRYQTVFARDPGAVAAPTAGLHFTDALVQRLEEQGIDRAEVLLHVGLGTFNPIEVDDIRAHHMHAEDYEVPDETALAVQRTRAEGGRVIAVGTTSLRALESAWCTDTQELRAGRGRTDIFIHPPRVPKSIDGLITNFHLPRSSLLLLVSALAGREKILQAYGEAVRLGYRFFSYGDAMLIL